MIQYVIYIFHTVCNIYIPPSVAVAVSVHYTFSTRYKMAPKKKTQSPLVAQRAEQKRVAKV